MESPEIQKLTLELGDIIKIISSSNSDINDKIFFINYIDKDKCKIINVKNKEEIILNITENEFDDKSIESIKILNRSSEIGYARQNNLLTGKWITVMFGGEIPLTINGQITDLEEDMIEISIWPDNEKIYIDFAYKGLPENLNITSINNFKDPRKKEHTLELKEESKDTKTKDDRDQEKDDDDIDDNLIDEFYQESKIGEDVTKKRQERDIEIVEADDIVFGESFDEVEETVFVSESEKRYTIQNQANDLLDDLLSTVPTIDRTKDVLNNLHKMVERFKELRTLYSEIDDKNNSIKIKKHNKNHKPILNNILNLNKNIGWILPICKVEKKIYDFEIDEDNAEIGIKEITLAETQKIYQKLLNNIKKIPFHLERINIYSLIKILMIIFYHFLIIMILKIF